jgi:two-component system NtrC family sensor kinase
MTKPVKLLFLLLIPLTGIAQTKEADNLRGASIAATTDSAKFIALGNIEQYYLDANRDSALYYGEQTLALSKRSGQALTEAICLDIKGYELTRLGRYPEALQCFQQGVKIFDEPTTGVRTFWNYTSYKFSRAIGFTSIHLDFGDLLGLAGNKKAQLDEYEKVRRLADPASDPNLSYALMSIGREYTAMNKLDSALILEQEAENVVTRLHSTEYTAKIYVCMGDIFLAKKDNTNALLYYHKAIIASVKRNDLTAASDAHGALTGYFITRHQKDSSLFYAIKTISLLHLGGSLNYGDAYNNLSKSYMLAKNIDSAYKYKELALTANQKSYNSTLSNLTGFQKLSFNEQLKVQQLEKEKEAVQTRIRTYILLAGIGILMLLAAIFYRNNTQKRKANTILEGTLTNLKSAQNQLIQSEKMASLGELTAGIAHEIQNPLNFVNNFSEVNREMIDELKEELQKGDIEEAIAIANDIRQNEEKINHHGKRADAIVKGMLEHSRVGTGEKQLTDLNALADEFLKLSYHGFRAKDKNFNAELITHFDETLPKVNIVPQDIGRVLLNLFNNAFYAVNEKSKTAGSDYKPTVTVATFAPPSPGESSRTGGLGVSVRDNGNGIPDAIKDKIMQPFFTTKPTGEGTGLGLSLSYDIVVKGHKGSIDIKTVEGEYTEFIIILPLN